METMTEKLADWMGKTRNFWDGIRHEFQSGNDILPRISDQPRRLIRLLKSKNIRARTLALRSLASMDTLPDWQCTELIESCYDAGLMASLAVRGSCIPEHIRRLAPVFDQENKPTVEKELRTLLAALHPFTRDSCVQLNTELALRNVVRPATSEHEEVLWTDPEDEEERPLWFGSSSKIQKLLLYMEALGLESTLPPQRERMIDAKTFDLLSRIWDVNHQIDPTDFRLPKLILKVLSNMALSQHSAGHFLTTGWMATLAKCRKMEKIELRLLADKCLINISNGSMATKENLNKWIHYDDGIYVLNDSSDKESKVDIVFVHGLRGGVFYSWRQTDAARKLDFMYGKSLDQWTSGRHLGYTYCWPKDWLPNDLNENVRILGVDYASFVTNWRMKCPEFHERNTIIARSKDLLQKLLQAGIGDRPIIWVCHSMGGLIVKEMLCSIYKQSMSNAETTIDQEEMASKCSKMVEKTKGIVFYSVPHFGSPVASRTIGWNYRYFLLPSVEVTELCENSKYLQLLQDSFVDLESKMQIPVISFMETLPSNFPMRISMVIVPDRSSNLGLGQHYRLKESHLSTCKPLHRDSVNYRILVDFLNSLLS